MRFEKSAAQGPFGGIVIYTIDGRLAGLVMDGFDAAADEAALIRRVGAQPEEVSPSLHKHLYDRVKAYLAGDKHALQGLELNYSYGTDFERAVWSALTDIPPGKTSSYAAIAQSIGRPSAVRAVGAACGRNPIPLAVPCHRAVGSDGRLRGFRGGLELKQRLLVMEGAL